MVVLLLLLPFFDRSPERHPLRRPIATVAGIATIAAMAYLTVLGAVDGSPTEIEPDRPAQPVQVCLAHARFEQARAPVRLRLARADRADIAAAPAERLDDGGLVELDVV